MACLQQESCQVGLARILLTLDVSFVLKIYHPLTSTILLGYKFPLVLVVLWGKLISLPYCKPPNCSGLSQIKSSYCLSWASLVAQIVSLRSVMNNLTQNDIFHAFFSNFQIFSSPLALSWSPWLTLCSLDLWGMSSSFQHQIYTPTCFFLDLPFIASCGTGRAVPSLESFILPLALNSTLLALSKASVLPSFSLSPQSINSSLYRDESIMVNMLQTPPYWTCRRKPPSTSSPPQQLLYRLLPFMTKLPKDLSKCEISTSLPPSHPLTHFSIVFTSGIA